MIRYFRIALILLTSVAATCCSAMDMVHGGVQLRFDRDGGKFSFTRGGSIIITAAPGGGVLLDGAPVRFRSAGACAPKHCLLHGANAAGKTMTLEVSFGDDGAAFEVSDVAVGSEVRFASGGASPAFGLADHAVYHARFEAGSAPETFSTDVSGFADDDFHSGQGIARLVSNFVVYPKAGFAELLIDPGVKIVHTSAGEIVQGVKHFQNPFHVLFFFGDPHAIYAQYQRARNRAGYKVWPPKYEAFGVGWEAFGALGWNTNTTTVRESVDRYLHEGYPLRWIVIGSGFWPSTPDTMHETTSFGLWDREKYPEPEKLVQHFRDEKLAVMLGLRITFIVGGPYSEEGVSKGYFLQEDGKAKVFEGSWPKLPYYLINAQNKDAVDWYLRLVGKWQQYGISGWKEDFYGYGAYPELRDDKVDPTNDRLMAQGQLVIERNGYLSSNGDLHRINDFNFNQNQDRGPVNALALAYSGFPFVYPDIVGGTFGEQRFSTHRTPRMERYMMRNAQWASLHSSMGMGEPPWTFSPAVASVMLKSAHLHARIAPYLFSNARRTLNDGFPWTMTPLPLAFPTDSNAYGRENSSDRGYEWLIGDAMLAVPLYGDDYDTADTRDVYLPEGQWMDFDTGTIYPGHQLLRHFALPPGKTPLFIGGSGVTLEEIDGVDRVCVYPVARSASVNLSLPQSETTFQVLVVGQEPEKKPRGVRVSDAQGHTVVSRVEGHGFSFVPSPGQSFTVEFIQ